MIEIRSYHDTVLRFSAWTVYMPDRTVGVVSDHKRGNTSVLRFKEKHEKRWPGLMRLGRTISSDAEACSLALGGIVLAPDFVAVR